MLTVIQQGTLRLAGLALLCAGLLKGHEAAGLNPAVGPRADWGWLTVSVGEVAVGLWMLSGLYPEFTRWGGALLFVGLLGVSLDKALGGEASCGCFGAAWLTVNPWTMVAFDSLVIVGLAWTPPRAAPTLSRRAVGRRLAAVSSLTLLVAAGLVLGQWSVARGGTAPGELADDVVLDPDRWAGEPFALGEYIDIGPALAKGRWAVMFFKPRCQECSAAIPRFVGAAYQAKTQPNAGRFALVEVPQAAETEGGTSKGTVCLQGRFVVDSPSLRRVRTPLFVQLRDGVVEKVTRSLDVLLRDMQLIPEGDASEGFLIPDYRRIRREMFLKEIACGPLALMAVLQATGISLTTEEVDELLAEAGDKGIDMLRLKQLAEERGLHAVGIATSTEGLRRLGHRAIVHLNGVGFAAVTGFTRDGVVLVKPLEPAGVLPDDHFARAFGKRGRALVVSRSPLRPESLGAATVAAPSAGPALGLSRSMMTVGRLHRRDWKSELTFTNEGTDSLRITKVTTSHSSFTASAERDVLAPGESTRLMAKGEHHRLGPLDYTIRVETNEANLPKRVIPVRGYAEAPLCFATPTVLFSSLLPGQTVEAAIEFEVPAGVDASRLRVKKVDGKSFTAELTKGPRGGVLKVRFGGSAEVGWHRSKVEIVGGDEEDAIPAELPCSAEVVRAVEVFPARLVIGEAGKWKRTLRVEYRDPPATQPSVRWGKSGSHSSATVAVSKLNGRAYAIELSGDVEGMRRTGDVTLEVDTGRGGVVQVPIRVEQARK